MPPQQSGSDHPHQWFQVVGPTYVVSSDQGTDGIDHRYFGGRGFESNRNPLNPTGNPCRRKNYTTRKQNCPNAHLCAGPVQNVHGVFVGPRARSLTYTPFTFCTGQLVIGVRSGAPAG
jgi:hypothetical protein